VYDVLPSFVLGFHGCDASVAEKVFAGRADLKPSENDYDWLGHGVYFWEQNPRRALDYARLLKKYPQRNRRAIVRRPAVVGAIIDLGLCLNLLDAQFLALVRDAFAHLEKSAAVTGMPLPRNRSVGKSGDLLLRNLDCSVIETAHELRNLGAFAPFSTVRGVFVEGAPLYDGAGFHAESHIQICVRDTRCIKGYFRVRT